MTRHLRRRRPDGEDTLKAAALGLGAGLAAAGVVFYLSRLLLTREVLGRTGEESGPATRGGSRPASTGGTRTRSRRARQESGRSSTRRGGPGGP